MAHKGKKPTPKSQREISEGLHTPYDAENINGGILQNPNSSDFDIDNRGNHLSFKGDKVKPLSISLMDLDEAVLYYLKKIIIPRVSQNGEVINVPILYGDAQRWRQIQKKGYLRDKKNQVMLPTIVFNRNTITHDRSLTSKIDANNPHNYNITQKHYSKKNSYDNFSQLTNRRVEKEFYSVVVPDYVTLNYSFVISTHYVEQMNKIIEAINYASDSYWGDPEKFKFKASIDSFANVIELPADGKRVVKTTFTLNLHGYIVPQVLQKDLNSQKKFNNKTQLIFGIETTLPYETLTTLSSSTISSGKPIFPERHSCLPVRIIENGTFLQTVLSGGTFSYTTSSNPIDITFNSSSFYSNLLSNQNAQIVNTADTEIGSKSGSVWLIQDTYIQVNNTFALNVASASTGSIDIVNDDGDPIGTDEGGGFFSITNNTIQINSITIQEILAESNLDITLVNTLSGSIGTNVDSSKVQVADVTIINSGSTYVTSSAAEGTFQIPNINFTDSDGTTSSIAYTQSIVASPPPVASDVYYNIPYLTQTVSYDTYDESWRRLNGGNDQNNAMPTLALIQKLQPDLINGRSDYLKYFNLWGHKFRYTGMLGGYFDEADGLYYDKDGVLSTKLGVYPVVQSGLWNVLDNLTGRWTISGRLGALAFTAYLDATQTHEWPAGTQPNWLAWTKDEANQMNNAADFDNSLRGSVSANRPFFEYNQALTWTCTTRNANTSQGLIYSNNTFGGSITVGTKSGANGNRWYFEVAYTASVTQP